ncbi:extracellular solute-binding protein [Patescibacteria group bacterium]|nr:extracellular solute-binding protein [Patescibacteria group bacterium]
MKGNFQIIVLIIFVVAAILGVLVFSGAIPLGKNSTGSLGKVVLWGTIPNVLMASAIKDFNSANPTIVVTYEEKSADTFDQDLLEAAASGTGPDIFFLPNDLVFHYIDKIFTIPYQSYPLASFKNNFATAGEIFLTANGILAFPISIDPLMMYYNRSILDANGVIYPPTYWDEMTDLAPLLTQKDNANKIIKSAIAFGQFSNVTHAKDIMATLFMQAGNPIIQEKNGTLVSALDSSIGSFNLPSILKFYTDFADPNNVTYSWNKSLPNSIDAFSREDLAFYFGFAGELQSLVNRNPNQNFFVAGLPQIRNSNLKITGARVTGLAISSFSKNFDAAFITASLMAAGDFASKLVVATGVAPARRDLLTIVPDDAYSSIFYSSALYGKSWLDPAPKNTDSVFNGMVNAVLSNNLSVAGAIKDANAKLNLLLLK